MGFLSRTFGGRKEEQPVATPSLDTMEAPSLPSSGPQLNVPSVPSSVPGGVDFMKPPEDASKIYNPYAGLRNVGSGAHPAFKVSRQPEFVFQEEAGTKRRAFSENIGFYTGVGYLSGAIGGGAVGLATGISQKPEGLNLTRRLLLNRLLNSSGQTGRMVGNTLGCLGLLFSVSESLSWWMYDEYVPYGPSWLGTVTAGALAGAIYRSPRGPRAAAITAAVGAAGASALVGLRQINPNL